MYSLKFRNNMLLCFIYFFYFLIKNSLYILNGYLGLRLSRILLLNRSRRRMLSLH